MKRLVLIALCGALAACGGGSAVPGFAPAASQAGAPNAPHPAASERPVRPGETFAYAGSLDEKQRFFYPTPHPLPPSNVTATVAQRVVVSRVANPYGKGRVADFHTVESDAYALQTLGSTTDAYYQSPANGSGNFLLLGYRSVDDAGNVSSMHYDPPAIVDELPETAGASWTNADAGTLVQTFTDNERLKQTFAADGSYVQTETLYGPPSNPGARVAATQNADGSGSLEIVWYVDANGNQSQEITLFGLSAPVQIGAVKTVRVSQTSYDVTTNPPPTPPPPAIVAGVPLWYEHAGHTETDRDVGSVTIPKTCKVPKSLATKANAIRQQSTDTDTVFGTLETTTVTQYVAGGYGVVCATLADTTRIFYDFNLDRASASGTPGLVFSGTPLQRIVRTETLAMQPKKNSISHAAIAFARLHLRALALRDRAERTRALVRRIRRELQKGVSHR